MSKGPGKVERRIAELFRRSEPGPFILGGTVSPDDRAFTVADLCREVFGCDTPTRPQRVSAARAARSAIRRATKAAERWDDLHRQAWNAAKEKFGGEPSYSSPDRKRFEEFYEAHPSHRLADRITDTKLASWRATERKDGQLVFHHRLRPVRVWVVDIQPAGLIWADAEIVAITASRVSVVYKGVRCPLDRFKLSLLVAVWRGVMFVSERSGRVGERLEEVWWERYGHLCPNLMPLEQARQMLRLPRDYTRDEIIAGFRKAAKRCHPDLGGTAEMFHKLVEARDRLLAALGTSEPAPEEPDFVSSGTRISYVSGGASSNATRRIGGTRRLTAQP